MMEKRVGGEIRSDSERRTDVVEEREAKGGESEFFRYVWTARE